MDIHLRNLLTWFPDHADHEEGEIKRQATDSTNGAYGDAKCSGEEVDYKIDRNVKSDQYHVELLPQFGMGVVQDRDTD